MRDPRAALARLGAAGYIGRMENPFEMGRTAAADDLVRALPGAPPGYLEGALANPALVPQHLLLLLKNTAVTAALILKVTKHTDWMKAYEVKAAIVLHLRTPRAIAMNLLTHLWWRDLQRVTDKAALAPPLRRTAERLLAIRLQELALGEKIALARLAGRGLINALRLEANPMVIRALLQNPRLVEGDALAIATSPRTPAVVLRVLSEDDRFASRPPVLKALARHPLTPPAVALRIVQRLSTRDLKELMHAPKVPSLVKVAAQRLIEARRKRGGKEGPGRGGGAGSGSRGVAGAGSGGGTGAGRGGGPGSDEDRSSEPSDSA
jgi:hypothetical protein